MKDGLTILSFGAGQDSTTILHRIISDPGFTQAYVRGALYVVFSDTGNEHPETYTHLVEVRQLCSDHKIPFIWITPEMGYHAPGWQSLQHHYETYDVIMMVSGRKSCTDQLKIRPIYKWLNDLVAQWTGYDSYRKKALIQYAGELGKVRVLLGIAKGEESRVAGASEKEPKWQQRSVEKVYPLIEIGLDRNGCQKDLESRGQKVPLPSNCMMCPFMSKQELLWLYRNHSETFWYWVDRENAKVLKNADQSRNHGALGEDLLEDQLAKATELYGHWSDDQLNEYKMSHGHCVTSKY